MDKLSKTQPDPNVVSTYLDKIRDVLTKPLTIYSSISLLFSIYFILRTFGIDVIPPFLNKVGIGSIDNIGIDVNGNYIYESFAMDSANQGYYHGGYFKMEQSVNPYGVKFGLSGFRTWRKYRGQQKEELMFPWGSDWGGIFEGKKIRFTYSIMTTEGAKIRGYVEGDIHSDKNGKVEKIFCNFNQLPPSPPMYGTMIIIPINKEVVDKTDVFEIVPPKD